MTKTNTPAAPILRMVDIGGDLYFEQPDGSWSVKDADPPFSVPDLSAMREVFIRDTGSDGLLASMQLYVPGGDPRAACLAASFADMLRLDLRPEQLRQAVALNRAETGDVCHTHDFVDANMTMSSAFAEQGLRLFARDGTIPEESTALWNEAWRLAKAAEFDPDRIHTAFFF